jgi:8-oxo-dGTP pyrophosphatase MutT (NUDIX family)
MKRGSPTAEEFERSTLPGPSDFQPPPLSVTADSLAAYFQSEAARVCAPLRNPHHEPRVSEREAREARPAAVLIAIVKRHPEPTLLLTRRHENISYGGHICFAGGGREACDSSLEATALRESFEEIALAPESVEVLGRLGDYVTHSGFRIAPIVALVSPPLDLRARPGEVDEILEIPLAHALRPDSYQLRLHTHLGEERGHFFLAYEEWIVSGPTVALMMGLYEELAKTHDPN